MMQVLIPLIVVLGSVVIFTTILVKLQYKGIYLIPNPIIIEKQCKERGTVVEGELIDVKHTSVYNKKTYTNDDDLRNYDSTYKLTYSYVINQQQYTYKLLNDEPENYHKVLLYYDPNNNNKILLVTSKGGNTVLHQSMSKVGVFAIILLGIIDIVLINVLLSIFG